VEHLTKMGDLKVEKTKELAAIETKKFAQSVEAIGRDTIVAMAKAGPNAQAELLAGLGLQGYILTDGNNPINLLTTANSMIGNMNTSNIIPSNRLTNAPATDSFDDF